VIKHIERNQLHEKDPEWETWYGIHEVFYDLSEKGSISWTEDPVSVISAEEEIEGLKRTLQMMMDCLDKPILELKDGEDIRETEQ